MKSSSLFILCIFVFSACYSPQHFAQKGQYDKAIDHYSFKLRDQKPNRKKTKDLEGVEAVFNQAQSRDSAELAQLFAVGEAEHWPRINELHRQIQARQNKISKLPALRSKKGYAPQFSMVENIAVLESDSRRKAASYLYQRAQDLLSITETSGMRQPAREAYALLRELKSNYFPFWENANALLDSAYRAGKTHILIETSAQNGLSDEDTFWSGLDLSPKNLNQDWLICYTDPGARERFDFRARCRLVSLYVGSESTSETTRIETKQVEDGYDETQDSSGHVISRTPRYKCETTTITTYFSSRSANASMMIEIIDETTGQVATSNTLFGEYQFDENSELFRPMSPTYWGMIHRVAGDLEWDFRRELRKVY